MPLVSNFEIDKILVRQSTMHWRKENQSNQIIFICKNLIFDLIVTNNDILSLAVKSTHTSLHSKVFPHFIL